MLLFYFATFVYRFHVAGEFAFVYTTHEKQPYPQWDIGSLSILDPMILFLFFLHRNANKNIDRFCLDEIFCLKLQIFSALALWSCNYFFVWLRTSTFEMPNVMLYAIGYDENFSTSKIHNRMQPVNRNYTEKN